MLTRPPASPLRVGPTLAPDAARALRRTLELRCFKWDVQVGDVTALAPFPLLIGSRDWDELAQLAVALAEETAALEAALWARPELQARVGVPRTLRRLWQRAPMTPAAQAQRRAAAGGAVHAAAPAAVAAPASAPLRLRHVRSAGPLGHRSQPRRLTARWLCQIDNNY